MKRNEEHAFIRIGKDIKSGKMPGIILLYGKEEFLVNFYGENLIRSYVNKATEALDLVRLEGDVITPQAVAENLETMPLMSERKVVYVPNLYDSKGRLPKPLADSSASTEQLAEYIKNLSGEGMLLLITFARQNDDRNEAEIRRGPIYKAIEEAEKAGRAAIYDLEMLDPARLNSFIEKRFKASGKTYRPGIVNLVARQSGYLNKNIDYGLFDLENDLRKIIAHCGDNEEITQADVDKVITTNPENDVFAMLDAIGLNRKDEAFRLLHNLIQDGSSPFQLLALITAQLELMIRTCELKYEGYGLNEIQQILKKSPHKIHEYRTKKALEAGNRIGVKKLKSILSSAYEVELNVKTGLMPGDLALEYFIAGI